MQSAYPNPNLDYYARTPLEREREAQERAYHCIHCGHRHEAGDPVVIAHHTKNFRDLPDEGKPVCRDVTACLNRMRVLDEPTEETDGLNYDPPTDQDDAAIVALMLAEQDARDKASEIEEVTTENAGVPWTGR